VKREGSPWLVAASLTACVAVGAFFMGCGSGDRTLAEVDPASAPEAPTLDQVFAIIQRECTPCHKGEETEPPLENRDDVADNAGAIYDVTVVKNNMPPGAWPRLTSEEKLLIARWAGEDGGHVHHSDGAR
jgi:uncharacterized membrane protein